MNNITFQTIDWEQIETTEHKGKTGTAFWKTLQYSGLRSERYRIHQVISRITGVRKVISSIVWRALS